MKRIVIVGSWGAGKSTLAGQVGQAIGREVIYLDTRFWKPGWTATTPDEQKAIITEILPGEEWIIEGDHPLTQPERFRAADTILFLDYPRTLCLQRALSRTLRYWGKQRPGGPEGCREFFHFRVFKWIWRYPARRRPALLKNIQEFGSHCTLHRLTTPEETAAFLAKLSASSGP